MSPTLRPNRATSTLSRKCPRRLHATWSHWSISSIDAGAVGKDSPLDAIDKGKLSLLLPVPGPNDDTLNGKVLTSLARSIEVPITRPSEWLLVSHVVLVQQEDVFERSTLALPPIMLLPCENIPRKGTRISAVVGCRYLSCWTYCLTPVYSYTHDECSDITVKDLVTRQYA